MTIEDIQKKLQEIDKQMISLREQALKLIGKAELLQEQAKAVPESDAPSVAGL